MKALLGLASKLSSLLIDFPACIAGDLRIFSWPFFFLLVDFFNDHKDQSGGAGLHVGPSMADVQPIVNSDSYRALPHVSQLQSGRQLLPRSPEKC